MGAGQVEVMAGEGGQGVGESGQLGSVRQDVSVGGQLSLDRWQFSCS